MKEYNIGQILFLVTNEEFTLFPALVIEELKKKTQKGTTVHYTVIVALKNGKTQKEFLHKLNVETFEDIEAARAHLIGEASSEINRICASAQDLASKNFNTDQDAQDTAPPLEVVNEYMGGAIVKTKPKKVEAPRDRDTTDDWTSVTLDDGVKARVVMPSILPPAIR
jgi:hypothetical protein